MSNLTSARKVNVRFRLSSSGKLFFLLLFIPAFSFSQANTPPASNSNPVQRDLQGPTVQFKIDAWDFGDIPQGIPVTHVFEYSNIGKEPLIVSQATASCGCTTPVWTKEPVLSGKTGTVSVTFNAAHEGSFTKTVTVLSNSSNPAYLTIKGNVIAKKTDDNTTPKQN